MTYFEKLQFVKSKAVEYLKTIYKVYGNELLLKLEDYNLLSNPDNCIKSSTAPGFIMEEFAASKLITFTSGNDGERDIAVKKIVGVSTVGASYDCFTEFGGVRFLINFKAEKLGGTNSGIAAINKLHNDYVNSDPETVKSFLVLKTVYDYDVSKKDGERKIFVKDVKAFCLEEIDFTGGHKQDHRNWSEEFKKASGRLQVDDKFLREHALAANAISYEKTRGFIERMFGGDAADKQ